MFPFSCSLPFIFHCVPFSYKDNDDYNTDEKVIDKYKIIIIIINYKNIIINRISVANF